MGEVLIRSITVGIIAAVEEKLSGIPEDKRAAEFTYSILDAMTEESNTSKEQIQKLPAEGIEALVNIAVEHCGVEKEYRLLPDELTTEERFYGAYLERDKKIRKSFQEQMAKTRNFYSYLNKQNNVYKNLFSAQEEINRSLIKSITEVLDHQTRIAGQLFSKSWLDQLPKPIDFSKDLQKSFERTEQLSEEIGPVLQEAGFWIAPSIPIKILRIIVEMGRNGETNPDKIAQLFVDVLEQDDYTVLRSMVNRWENNPYFKKRILIIMDALEAHINGKFTLSIPALLPMIEGILTEIVGRRPTQGERMTDWIQIAIDDMCSDFMQASLKNVILTYLIGYTGYKSIEKEYFTPDEFPKWLEENGYSAKDILNRHAILHGVHIDYASKENSLRAFMILDVLSELRREE